MKRVLMVQASRDDWSRLETGLVAAGYFLEEVVPLSDALAERVALLQPEIVLVEADEPTPQMLKKLGTIDESRRCPVIMVTRSGSDEMVMRAMQSGVILHVVEALTPLLLHSLIEVAIQYFYSQRLLQDELDGLQQELADHRFIEQAKCLLMEEQGLSEQQAYATLRRTAMDRSQRIVDVCRAILAAHSRETGTAVSRKCS